MKISALLLSATLAMPYGSLKEFAESAPNGPGLASCGSQKPILVNRTVPGEKTGAYFRLTLNPDLDRFVLSAHDANGDMVHSWYGTVSGENFETKTFALTFAGNRQETMAQFESPCNWLYPSVQ